MEHNRIIKGEITSDTTQSESVENIETHKNFVDVVPAQNDVKDENLIKKENVEPVDSTSIILNDSSFSDNDQKNVVKNENECSKHSIVEANDDTIDTCLNQSEEQSNISSVDVLKNSDNVESVALNSNFEDVLKHEITLHVDNEVATLENGKCMLYSEESKNDNKATETIKEHAKQNAENSERNDWYQKKLAEKERIIKERLSKLAKVLRISFPCYANWLEHKEKSNGSLCKLKPSIRCCLDKPYPNRLKFMCTRKEEQDHTAVENSSDSFPDKNKKIVWKVEINKASGVSSSSEYGIPPFILQAVKVFEDFLQTTEQLSSSINENISDDVSMDMESKKDVSGDNRQEWISLVVRCNRMNELMLFATGKNITQSAMGQLKELYKSGTGMNCNVKSVYCKSLNKNNNTILANTTLLFGSEALDEIVGGLKVQLAPKTNFWSNTAGAESIAKAVINLLTPNKKTTVLEIGCGIGIISMIMASKCQQVIGVDLPSEVEEAEMICKLNNIKNASFITGSSTEVVANITTAIKGRETCAVVNANTEMGRAIEIMAYLRNVSNVQRLVMITTLTKQSVRTTLELARPKGCKKSPFLPTVACVVDTLPTGPHSEAVILLQRRRQPRPLPDQPMKDTERSLESLANKNTQYNVNKQNDNFNETKILPKGMLKVDIEKNKKKSRAKRSAKKWIASAKKNDYVRSTETSIPKGKFNGKRPHSPDKEEATPNKLMKKFGKLNARQRRIDLPLGTKKWNAYKYSDVPDNLLHENQMGTFVKHRNLRKKLSNDHLGPIAPQTVEDHEAILPIAQDRLGEPVATVDINTAKQLQSMLNMVLQQANKIQKEVHQNVWDQPPAAVNEALNQRQNEQRNSASEHGPKMGHSNTFVMMQNKNFPNVEENPVTSIYPEYNNVMPLNQNVFWPSTQSIDRHQEQQYSMARKQRESEARLQQTQNNAWSRERSFERSFEWNRTNDMTNKNKQTFITKRDRQGSFSRSQTSKRFASSHSKRPYSPSRGQTSLPHHTVSPDYIQHSNVTRQMTPDRRPVTPYGRSSSPQDSTAAKRIVVIINQPESEPWPQESSQQQQLSSVRHVVISPSIEQQSPINRSIPYPSKQIPFSNFSSRLNDNKQVPLLSTKQATPQEKQKTWSMKRAVSPEKVLYSPISLSRWQQPLPNQQISLPKFTNNQDTPSLFVNNWNGRNAFTDNRNVPNVIDKKQNIWSRCGKEKVEQNTWQTERLCTSSNNWQQTVDNDNNGRNMLNQNLARYDTGTIGRNNTWNSNKSCSKLMDKSTWSSSSDNTRLEATNTLRTDTGSWHIRRMGGYITCERPWTNNRKQNERISEASSSTGYNNGNVYSEPCFSTNQFKNDH